ncbi:MAG: hypothetical protein ACTSR7_20265 [Promethearchaeota archaeon]
MTLKEFETIIYETKEKIGYITLLCPENCNIRLIGDFLHVFGLPRLQITRERIVRNAD